VSRSLEIDGNTLIRLCDLGARTAVLSREQWAIACAIDGAQTVQDLAWRCGLALYEAVEWVGLLVQAGVCAPCAQPEGPAGPLAQWSGGGDFRDAAPELLRRVLDGLRRLG